MTLTEELSQYLNVRLTDLDALEIASIVARHKKGRKGLQKKSFTECELYDKRVFAQTFSGWPTEKLKYYYEAADAYSTEGNKYVDWKKAINNWASRDAAKHKLKFNEMPTTPTYKKLT